MNELRILAKIFYVFAYIFGIIGFTILFFVLIMAFTNDQEVFTLFVVSSTSLIMVVICKLSQIGIDALNYIVEAARKYTNK